MSTKKTPTDDALAAAVEPVSDSVALTSDVPVPKNKADAVGKVFRDTVFTSRTLILANGRAVLVMKGQVLAEDADMERFLTAHPNFEPITE